MLYEIPEHNKISGETNFPVDTISGKFVQKGSSLLNSVITLDDSWFWNTLKFE